MLIFELVITVASEIKTKHKLLCNRFENRPIMVLLLVITIDKRVLTGRLEVTVPKILSPL